MEYRFKPGARIKASAQTVGEVCADLEKDNNLTPKGLVDVSRAEDAPLHDLFEWDDSIAGEKYREVQAGKIIRSIEITYEEKTPVRAFFPVKYQESTEKSSYKSISVVLRNTDMREQVLSTARREMTSFVCRYKNIEELANVIEAMENNSLFDQDALLA